MVTGTNNRHTLAGYLRREWKRQLFCGAVERGSETKAFRLDSGHAEMGNVGRYLNSSLRDDSQVYRGGVRIGKLGHDRPAGNQHARLL